MGRRAVEGPPVLRGQVWLADVGLEEAKRFIVISNNERNRKLHSVLGVRLTTAPKPSIPSIVEFRPGEIGSPRSFAIADDITSIRKSWLVGLRGALNRGQIRRVEDAIKVALDLD